MKEQVRQRFLSPTCFVFLFWGSFLITFIPVSHGWIWRTATQCLIAGVGWRIKTWRNTILGMMAVSLFYLLNTLLYVSPETCRGPIHAIEGEVQHPYTKSIKTLKLEKIKLLCGPQITPLASAHVTFEKPVSPYFFRSGDRLKISKFNTYTLSRFSIKIQGGPRTKIFNESGKERTLQKGAFYYYIQNKALYYLDPFPAAVFIGLMTADRRGIERRDKLAFQKLGISHLFAISGLHIGILYLWLSFVLRHLISIPTPWIAKGKGVLGVDLFCLIIIYFYIHLMGSPISAIRAYFMLLWWMLIRHFIPWQSLWYILSMVGSLILLDQPAAIGQTSYQLSFLSLAGILFLQPLFQGWRNHHSFFRKMIKALFLSFCISLYLFLLSFPIINSFARELSLLSPVNNIFHIAFMSWLFLPLCMMGVFILVIGYPFWGFSGEGYLFYVINQMGHLWKFCMDWSMVLNQPAFFSFQYDWGITSRLLYWFILGLISYGFRGKLLKRGKARH